MEKSVLESDLEVRNNLPHFILLKASAGSGKTHTLTKRYVQFLLSRRIPFNQLRNILAITFSNNSAKEMKERILLWLKAVYLEDPAKTRELKSVLVLDGDEVKKMAGTLIEEILDNYSDFQVKTIDSFMTSVFKTAAIDLGFYPDFEILMKNRGLFSYAFDLFLRKVRYGAPEEAAMEAVINKILKTKKENSSFLWEPSEVIIEGVGDIHRKLSGLWKEIKVADHAGEMEEVKAGIKNQAEKIGEIITRSGMILSKGSSWSGIQECLRHGNFADLIGKGLTNLPVKKPGSKKNADSEWAAYELIIREWETFRDLVRQYCFFYARTYHNPYLEIYETIREIIERVKREQGVVFIEDINKKLACYLNAENIPDVYFRIGETIYHYLIDEFQDTSPIQWKNLFPLMENSLAQGGSLLVVGDTKQAIYGFRDADYRIMKKFENDNPFPSANHEVRELSTNYRSMEGIIDFNARVFKKELVNSLYQGAGARSGLTDYVQNVHPDNLNKGYVEINYLPKGEEDVGKAEVQRILEESFRRGYTYEDVVILTPKNENVVMVTGWLNEKDIPFISLSSLDIRRRKITGEVVALLDFLDSPLDNFSFTTFILSDIFLKTVGGKRETVEDFLFLNRHQQGRIPLYKEFQKRFPEIWEKYLEGLFNSVGYLPLYDLVSEIFITFNLFGIFNEEEAALVRILEIVKDFEDTGNNNLKDFLTFAGDEEDEGKWSIAVPRKNAVKVMTVHKSKGLEFPVVIALLFEKRLNKGFDYIVQEEEDGVLLLKINQSILNHEKSFMDLYAEEEGQEHTGALNNLYVGFTRAKAELYVLGIKGEENKFPFEILPSRIDSRFTKPLQVEKQGEERGPGGNGFSPVILGREKGGLKHSFIVSPELKFNEKKRGELIHRILYFIELNGEEGDNAKGEAKQISDIIRRVRAESGEDLPGEDPERTILEFLKIQTVREYFMKSPGLAIKKEQEFSDAGGKIFRVDRLIMEEDRVRIIEFKTGRDHEGAEEGYRDQVKNYLRIIQEIYPGKKTEGFLAYVDLKEVRAVEMPEEGKKQII